MSGGVLMKVYGCIYVDVFEECFVVVAVNSYVVVFEC